MTRTQYRALYSRRRTTKEICVFLRKKNTHKRSDWKKDQSNLVDLLATRKTRRGPRKSGVRAKANLIYRLLGSEGRKKEEKQKKGESGLCIGSRLEKGKRNRRKGRM